MERYIFKCTQCQYEQFHKCETELKIGDIITCKDCSSPHYIGRIDDESGGIMIEA